MAKKKSFEDALGKLEKIVHALEEGGLSLERSLELYEEGIGLARFCNLELEKAEKKVEILKKAEEGEAKREDFQLPEEKEEKKKKEQGLLF